MDADPLLAGVSPTPPASQPCHRAPVQQGNRGEKPRLLLQDLRRRGGPGITGRTAAGWGSGPLSAPKSTVSFISTVRRGCPHHTDGETEAPEG